MWVQTAESADLQIRTLDMQSNVLLGFWIPLHRHKYRKTKRTIFRASWKTSVRKLPKPYTGQCGRPYVEIAPEKILREINNNEQRHRRARRLVGGTPVSRGEWPWIVQVI